MTTASRMEQLFGNLDRWRHLPAYQLERRADVFFSLWMRDVVQQHTGLELEEVLLPELPVKRDLIWPDHPTSKSVKVDYALFTRDRTETVFVELKTDASRRSEQDAYLTRCSEIGLRPIVEGVRDILLATTAHQKYHHLAHELAELGFLELPGDLADFTFPAARPGLTEHLKQVRVPPFDCGVRVLYVQPEPDGPATIGFGQFAEVVRRDDDLIAQQFAGYLLRWIEPPAAQPP